MLSRPRCLPSYSKGEAVAGPSCASGLELEKSNRLGLVTKSVSQPDGPPEQRAHVCTAQVTSYEELKTKALSGR